MLEEPSAVEQYAKVKLKQEQMKAFSTLITIGVIVFLIIVGIATSLIQKGIKYSHDNMMVGEIGLGYMFGDGAERTNAVIKDVYKIDEPFEFNGSTYRNSIVIDMSIDYDNDTDYYYYLFQENDEIEYMLYDSDSNKIKFSKMNYIRDRYNGKLRVILEANKDISNIQWVRIFGLNTDRMNYEKTSLCYKLN
ncbi:hypothetical protein [Cellulosilyticum sp. I15G10I2]|uniref:hypothetical protein n=1 Tax=Cellulosilyticum sp. I15G10I2 TaxID=1892843 RepID=UPI00085BF725|nr:hypothetical protein [Cellulosilyticum sp. I15G10I2]